VAIDAQAARLAVHGDEQQADFGIDDDIAEALEHAVPVIVGESKFGRTGHAHKAGFAALEGGIRVPLGIRGGQEEIRQGFDERLVVVSEFRVGEPLLQPIRNPAALEPILQLPVTLVIQDARRHALPPAINGGRGCSPRGRA